MRWAAVLLVLLPLLVPLLAVRPALACGTAVLELGVRDLNDKPVARIAFDIDVDGAQRTMETDASGLLSVSCLETQAVRIVAARTAAGQPLTMDENTQGGGLTIPLVEGQTQRLPLRLTGTLLFVEPIAEGEQSAIFSGTPSAAPSVATAPNAGANAPVTAVTPPIPAPARPAWFWWVVALVLALPTLVGAVLWLRGAAARRRRAQ